MYLILPANKSFGGLFKDETLSFLTPSSVPVAVPPFPRDSGSIGLQWDWREQMWCDHSPGLHLTVFFLLASLLLVTRGRRTGGALADRVRGRTDHTLSPGRTRTLAPRARAHDTTVPWSSRGLSEAAELVPDVAGSRLRSPSAVRRRPGKVLGEARLLQQRERSRQKLLQSPPRAALSLPVPRESLPTKCRLDVIPAACLKCTGHTATRGLRGERLPVLGSLWGGRDGQGAGRAGRSSFSDGLWAELRRPRAQSELRSCWPAHVLGTRPRQAPLNWIRWKRDQFIERA